MVLRFADCVEAILVVVVGWRIGMRWWLAGAFVVIAAATAMLVATVASRQTGKAVQSNSKDVAVGKAVSAAFSVERAANVGDLEIAVPVIAARRGLALFAFARGGRLLSRPVSGGISWRWVPGGAEALRAGLQGHRFVRTSQSTGATLIALPLRRSAAAHALVAYAPRPVAYGRSLAIFRREMIRATLWAVLAAAVAGLLAAALIARRLRRIAAAAAAIERGNFDVELRPRFADEVGSLALSIDRMRRQLSVSFERLRGERDRLGRLLEQLHEGVLAVDEQLVVRFANAAVTRFAVRPSLVGGAPLADLWAGVPLRELARGLFRRDAAVAEARGKMADGRVVSIVGVPAGASELAVLVLTDITEQEQRERAEREFVANASHELRTPVSAIVSAVEALQSGAKDVPAERDAFVALIERQATRLTRLIRSLLLLARAQTGPGGLQLEPVLLRPLLEEVAGSSELREEVRVEVRCADGLVAFAQRDVAEQIVSNLLGNALRHSQHGTVVLAAHPVGPDIAIEVSDEGPGVPIEVQGRIFDRFYSGQQGRRDGFGLGLAIVRDAVRALGGSVEIDSEPGRGTTVRVILTGRPGG